MAQKLNEAMWKQLLQRSARDSMSLQGQIREMLVSAILDGQLPPGVPVPSSREMADQLGVARNTVVLAYQQLADEGYLVSRQRSGHFVNAEMVPGRARGARAAAARRAGLVAALHAAPGAAAQHRQAGRLAEVPAPLPLRPVRRVAVPHRRLARVLHQGAV